MSKRYLQANRVFLIAGMALGWFALLAQLYLTIVNNPIPITESVTRYFSYFTILTNIITALCFSSLLIDFNKSEARFFSKPGVLAAVTVYISVVGIVYNLILRFTWQPQGLQFIVDELLHAILPVLFITYWLIFVPKKALSWSDTFLWLIYPFVYLIFVLLRGGTSGFYPYPFIDVLELGYQTVLINSFYLLIVFLTLSLLLVWIGKLIESHRKKNRHLGY